MCNYYRSILLLLNLTSNLFFFTLLFPSFSTCVLNNLLTLCVVTKLCVFDEEITTEVEESENEGLPGLTVGDKLRIHGLGSLNSMVLSLDKPSLERHMRVIAPVILINLHRLATVNRFTVKT